MVGGTTLEAELLWYGLAPSTRRTYEGHALAYTYFAQLHHLPTPYFPAPAASISAWIAWEANEIIRKGGDLYDRTLQRKVAGLRSWHVDIGSDPEQRIQRVIAGAVRKWGTVSRDQPLPITLPILRRVCEYISEHPTFFGGRLQALALRAAFTLAFACFLRKAEFTYDTFDPDRHMSRSSVSFSADGKRASLRLPASKTDPGRKGTEIPIPAGTRDLCPLRLLRRWFAESPAPGSAPLFDLGGHPFEGARIVSFLRMALNGAGYPADAFTGHSFRSGAATWAASIGHPTERIKIMGRWVGDSVHRYVRLPAADHLAAASGLLTASANQSTLPADGIPHRYQIWKDEDAPVDS